MIIRDLDAFVHLFSSGEFDPERDILIVETPALAYMCNTALLRFNLLPERYTIRFIGKDDGTVEVSAMRHGTANS